MTWLKKVGWFVLALIAAVVAWLFWKNPVVNLWREISDRIDREVQEERENLDEIVERQKKRRKISDRLAEWLDKLPVLLLVIMLLVTGPVQAVEPGDEFDQLLQYYSEMSQIAQEYKRLYEEAEADLAALIASNQRLQRLIEEQQKIINNLLKSSKVSISAGVMSLSDSYGFVATLNYHF